MRRRWASVAMAAAVLLGGGPASARAPERDRPRVLVYGDSITIEVKGSPEGKEVLAGFDLDWTGVKFMTAPCNGLAATTSLEEAPDVVVVDYSGNRGSYQQNCMDGEQGWALAERYRRDVQQIINRFRDGRTRIVVVGSPSRGRSIADDQLIFDGLRALADEPANAVAFFDGGRYLTPDRAHPEATAACLPAEVGRRCGTAGRGRNQIREASGLEHLCPEGGRINGTCDVYSSGAFRLALNLRDAIAAAEVAPTLGALVRRLW